MGSFFSPWDNAATESLMGEIKAGCVHARTFDTRDQTAVEAFDHIKRFHNHTRTHSTLDWLSPTGFEAQSLPAGDCTRAAQNPSTKAGQIRASRAR